MARSIVLRFDAECFDCGRSLPAGTTARWFGKGRVSCCGSDAARFAGRSDVLQGPRPAPAPAAVAAPPYQPIPPYLPSEPLAQLARDTGIDVSALASGLSPAQVATLAEKTPNQRLLVRLASGARFIVPALHAAHVLRCVAESCVDRIRDVALLAEGER